MEKMKPIFSVILTGVLLVAGVAIYILLDRDGDEATNVVYYVVEPPYSMKGALAANQIDGYIAWEPFVSDSIVGGVGSVLKWSGDILPNHPCCVVAVHNAFVSDTDGQELTARFVKAHMDATDWINEALDDPDGANYSLLVDIAVDFTERNESVVAEAMQHLEFRYVMDEGFTNALENFTEMYFEIGVIKEEKLDDRGYSSVDDFIDGYVDDSYLAAAETVGPSDTMLNPESPIRLGFLKGDIHQLAQAVAKNADVLGSGESIFEEYGLNVEDAIGAPFANGGAVMTAFAGGYVDIGYLGSPPAITGHLNAAIDTSIIGQANSEGSAIVVQADLGISDLSGLAGKTIAHPGTSSIQFLLLKVALQLEGLELKIRT
ncbi:MAG: ABC transporter substrate-binding protein [Methanobacteriota archaeon]|nr:MAG: ABC transporter substrate-binding protein [Euryarchaeota archaeon]